jgi:hypothetical protein
VRLATKVYSEDLGEKGQLASNCRPGGQPQGATAAENDDYPSRKWPKADSIWILSQMIFVIASIGTARIAPDTPHIQYQKMSANRRAGGRARTRPLPAVQLLSAPPPANPRRQLRLPHRPLRNLLLLHRALRQPRLPPKPYWPRKALRP